MNSEHYRNAYERHEKEEIPDMNSVTYIGDFITKNEGNRDADNR
jgi:hypothetical protein